MSLSLVRRRVGSKGPDARVLHRSCGLAAGAVLLLAALGCEEEVAKKEVYIEVAMTPPTALNMAEIRNCQSDPSANQAVVSANLINVEAGSTQVLFKIDPAVMNAEIPVAEDRGMGGFFQLAHGDPGPAAQLPPNIVALVEPGTNMAQVGFSCSLEGRVAIVAQDTGTGVTSEPRIVICEDRDPEAFDFFITPENTSTKLGETTVVKIEGDDGKGGKYLNSQVIKIETEQGGLFEDGSDSIIRTLTVDRESGRVKPVTPVVFRCPDTQAQYEITVELVDKVTSCSRKWTGYLVCSPVGFKDMILISADKHELEAASEEGIPPSSNRSDVLITIYGSEGLLPEQQFTLTAEPIGGFVAQLTDEPQKSITAKTDAQGYFRTIFVGQANSGVATLTAETTLRGPQYLPDGRLVVTATDQIKVIGASSIEYQSAVPGLLGVKGSGFNETSRVSFLVVGSDGNPYPAGLDVEFTIVSNVGGASLKATRDSTDENGLVSTYLSSGYVAANVTIRATVVQNGISSDSPAIPIVGVKPSWTGFALKCDLSNVGAFIHTDGMNSLMDESIPCRAKLKDRFGNPVGLSTAVSFRSEAGTISASVNSVPQQLSASGGAADAQANVGDIVALFNPNGVLPADVERDAPTEPVLDENRPDRNPRDGLVSIIAYVAGEESFVDANGNGRYDDGEMFVDLGEPFVDSNDNSIREDDEVFIDLPDQNGVYNGRWDSGNDKWDENTTIWTETRIVYSGLPVDWIPYNPARPAQQNPGMPILVDSSEIAPGCTRPCSGDFFSLPPGQVCTLFGQWVDDRGNILNSSAVYSIASEGVTVNDQGGSAAGDQLGMDWSLEKVCGAEICFVQSRVSYFGERRPQIQPACFTNAVRRLGHMHWVTISNENDADPFGGMQLVPMNAWVEFRASVRESPSGGEVFNTQIDFPGVVYVPRAN